MWLVVAGYWVELEMLGFYLNNKNVKIISCII